MAATVVGREGELAALADLFPSDAGAGLRVAVLTGEPGSGKSTLVDVIVGRAFDARHEVLIARPRPTEQELGFNALADLLEGVADLDGIELPPPQRTALGRALLLEPAGGSEADPRAVAAGLRTVLEARARETRVFVVIDDAHWLDTATAHVLTHALRRLRSARLSLLVSTRPTATEQDWPVQADGRRTELRLTGLSTPALFHLVRDHVGIVLDRRSLSALEQVSGGNPMYAVELARGLARADDGDLAPVSLTPPLEARVGRLIRDLPYTCRSVLLAAALAHEPTPDVVGAVYGMDADRLAQSLDAAARADVARVERGRVRFRHPLLAAAVVANAGQPEIKAVHARLAAVEDGVESAARHLALAAEGTDVEVAGRLSAAAREARSRGAHAAARDLAALALAKSPDGDAQQDERRITLADWCRRDGDAATCVRVLRPIVNGAGGRAARPKAHLLLAQAAHLCGDVPEMERHCQAVLDLTDDASLQAEALVTRAKTYTDLEKSVRDAVAARELLSTVAPSEARDMLAAQCMHVEAEVRLMRGDATAVNLLERAVELEAGRYRGWVSASAAFALAMQLMDMCQLDRSRAIFSDLLAVARDTGDEASEPHLLFNLGGLDLRSGRFRSMAEVSRDALALAELGGHDAMAILAAAQVALAEALTGDTEPARGRFEECAARAAGRRDPLLASIVASIRGRFHLVHDEAAAAVAQLRAFDDLAHGTGMVDPGWGPFPGDLAEALLASGDVDGAEAELAAIERRLGGLERPHVVAVVPRIRAQLLAARGQLDQVEPFIDAALRHQENVGQAFELARTLLIGGRLHRRAKHKRRAHDMLTRAAIEFDRLGTPYPAAVARRELERVGLRPAAPATLTATEAQVAELAVAGHTNREIAAAVYASRKTVEGILARVYRKLGVTSRVELVNALADQRAASTASPRH